MNTTSDAPADGGFPASAPGPSGPARSKKWYRWGVGAAVFGLLAGGELADRLRLALAIGERAAPSKVRTTMGPRVTRRSSRIAAPSWVASASIIFSCSLTARFHFSPSWLERKRSACRRALTWL